MTLPVSSRIGSAPSATFSCDTIHAQEIAVCHAGRGEDVAAHVVAIAQSRDLLDDEAQQDEAAIAVAAALARRKVGRLVDELGQEVNGLGYGVVGLRYPQIRVVLTGLLFSVITDAGGVGQQMEDVDVR